MRKFNAGPEQDPIEIECYELSNKLGNVVNEGSYSMIVVINALLNLFAVASADALLSKKLSFGPYILGFLAGLEDKLRQIAKIKDITNVSRAIEQLKKSAGLK